MRCPTCDKEFDPDATPTTLPFCCDRCRQADLNRWLVERHSIITEKPLHDDEELENPDSEQ
jgi:uncharacterized protein